MADSGGVPRLKEPEYINLSRDRLCVAIATTRFSRCKTFMDRQADMVMSGWDAEKVVIHCPLDEHDDRTGCEEWHSVERESRRYPALNCVYVSGEHDYYKLPDKMMKTYATFPNDCQYVALIDDDIRMMKSIRE